MIPFAKTEEGDRELIDMAFNKKKADDRKDWLRQFKVCCGQTLSVFGLGLTESTTAWNIH